MNKLLAALIATVFAAGVYAADAKPAAAASAPADAKAAAAAPAPKAASAPAAKKEEAKK